jgi:hypothetical protein
MTTGREINIVMRTIAGVDVASPLRAIVKNVDAAITVQSIRPLAGEVAALKAPRFAAEESPVQRQFGPTTSLDAKGFAHS